MGRKKTYDRDTLIERAMDLFHYYGFTGTSSQMLVDGLGVSRFSLYAEFENKQKLFEATLEHYNQTNVERNFGPLEASNAGIKEIRFLFEHFSSAIDGTAAGRGCLLCNTAVEFGPEDPGGAGFVKGYLERISKAFYKALNNSYKNGELKNDISVKKEADFFVASTLGLFVMIRAKTPPSVVKNTACIAIEHLEGLCV